MSDRESPGVLKAFAVGAVACGSCNGIHIDFIDKDHNIVATGLISFEQWHQLVVDTDTGMELLLQARRKS